MKHQVNAKDDDGDDDGGEELDDDDKPPVTVEIELSIDELTVARIIIITWYFCWIHHQTAAASHNHNKLSVDEVVSSSRQQPLRMRLFIE